LDHRNDPVALLTTGASTLLVYNGGENIALIGPTGVANSVPFIGGGFMGAAVHAGSYVLAVRTSPDASVTIDTIGDDGSASQRHLSLIAAGASRASFGDSSILVLTNSTYAVAGYDGTIIKPQTPIAAPAEQLAD